MGDVFYGIENNRKVVLMTMEYQDADLFGFIRKHFGPRMVVLPNEANHFCYQILLGLQHCHGNAVIHRDLKPGNILVNEIVYGPESRKVQLKIADFGLSRPIDLTNPGYTEKVGTRWYRAPEIMFRIPHCSKVDIWSVGCIYLQMLLGYPPFMGDNETMMLMKIFQVCGTPNETSWPGVESLPNWHPFPQWAPKPLRDAFPWPEGRIPNQLAIDLISKMLILDPTQRISALDALNHPHFNEIRSIYTRADQIHRMPSKL